MAGLAGVAALVPCAAYVAAALLPLTPALVSPKLDQSFAATLHFAAAHRGRGLHLISTYGPLGFAYYDLYDPATYGWLVGVQAVLAAAIGWSVGWIGWRGTGSVWGAVLALAGCTPLLAPADVRLLTLPLLMLWTELSRPRAPLPLRALLGIAVAIAALVKFTAFLAAMAVLAPLTLAEVAAARRVPVAAWCAVLAGIATWVGMGLGWADWVDYLRWSFGDVTPGYSSAMHLVTTVPLTLDAAAVTAAVGAAAAVLAWRQWNRARWLAALAFGAVLFLVFKAGFVRADVHVFITSFALLVLALLVAITLGGSSRRPEMTVLLVVGPPAILLSHAVSVQGRPNESFRAVLPNEAVQRLAAIPAMLRGGLAFSHAQRVAGMKAALPLPPLPGPVDIYSYEQGIPIALDLDLQPRPVFQSYMAYTPRLARANAAALEGARAPEWILFRPESIDHRFVTLDDAPSWPLLLTRYAAAGSAGPFAVLKRRVQPAALSFERLDTVQTFTESPVAVPSPADGPIWARIDVEETLADRALTVLWVAPRMGMLVTLSDGSVQVYAMVAAIARDGFLLSPLVERSEDFRQLVDGAAAGAAPAVTSLRMRVQRALGSAAQRRAVKIEFLRLRIGDDGRGRWDAPGGRERLPGDG